MKNKNFVLVPLLVLLVIVCGFFAYQYWQKIQTNKSQPSIQSNAGVGWLDYKNEQYGFEIKYPQGYEPLYDKIGDKVVGFFTENYLKQENRELLFDVSIISKEKIEGAGLNLSDLAKIGNYLTKDYSEVAKDESILLYNLWC